MLRLIICFTTFKSGHSTFKHVLLKKYMLSACASLSCSLDRVSRRREEGLAVVGTRLSQWERTLIAERTGEVSIAGSIWIRELS